MIVIEEAKELLLGRALFKILFEIRFVDCRKHGDVPYILSVYAENENDAKNLFAEEIDTEIFYITKVERECVKN